MNSNDLKTSLMKMFLLCVYQTKASNPGNTVATTNPLFDLLMTFNNLIYPPKFVAATVFPGFLAFIHTDSACLQTVSSIFKTQGHY